MGIAQKREFTDFSTQLIITLLLVIQVSRHVRPGPVIWYHRNSLSALFLKFCHLNQINNEGCKKSGMDPKSDNPLLRGTPVVYPVVDASPDRFNWELRLARP